jgi:hypothetical protein
MEKITLSLPTMYGDHHVSAVRDLLLPLAGIQELYASARFRQVIVGYDPQAISLATMEATLKAAGYPVGDGEPQAKIEPKEYTPSFKKLYARSTETNPVDLAMSGDYRKY